LPLCNPDASYSVTVGPGGLGGYAPNNAGKNGLSGNNSTITGCSINITALGGGYGSGWGTPVINPAGPGGSGGGLGNQPTCLGIAGTGIQPAQPITLSSSIGTFNNYGQTGGRATVYAVGGPDSAGGGGGAVQTGGNGVASAGGPGGSGYIWPFTGGTYGAGGGGAGFSSGGISFTGGTGAGQRYGIANTFHSGGIGNPGYGGGGGGGYGSSVLTQQGSGGPGGPGAVLFAYRSNTALYAGGCISTPTFAPGYIVHTFTSPGNLTFATDTRFALNYLVVGGGGSGGSGLGNVDNSGGGGAGGMLYGTTLSTPGIPYTITVGAGGTGSPLGLPTNNGNPSSLSAPGFTTVTATGGGAGGGMLTLPATLRGGQPGGSGGGAWAYGSPLVGTGTAGQGNPGGTSALGGPGLNNFGAGGGGGAGTPGGGGSPYHGGCGGAGRIWPFTNSYYAGGGGGSNSQQPGSVGLGGVGGGGPGTYLNALYGRAGAPGLGGGGGGVNSATPGPTGLVAGLPGGPGSVILIAPTTRAATTTGTVGLSYTGISGSGSFTGTTQYLTVPNSTALNLSNQPFTIEGWIYPMGVYNLWNTIITKRGITASSSAWEIGLAIDTGYFYFWNGGSVYYSSTTPTAHTWSHWAAVYDGTFMNLYLNGSRIHQIGISNTVDQANNVLIGTAAGEVAWQSYIGYMSNLRVLKGVQQYNGTTYTIPTEPFTSDVNTSLLTLQSGTSITDASNNAATISNYGPVTASFISPFSDGNGRTVYDFTSPGSITFGTLGPPIVYQYLVLAGGGGGSVGRSGGGGGGGGGAGGLQTGCFTLFSGTTYTINVGSGGAAGAPTVSGTLQQGGNSSISGSGIATVTSIGGGGGGTVGIPPNSGIGYDGGSGGGGGAGIAGNFAGGAATSYPSPTQQGYPGGSSLQTGNNSAGGGGAGGIGGPSLPTSGGNGGAGYTWPYTGLTYAGGGGGGGVPGNGTGGTGGGGNAGAAGTAGTPGLGGGGGGAPGAPNTNPGYAGGSGTVILAVPTPQYPGSAPGAVVTNPPAAPGMTVLTYTSPGTFIA
jgi:hypothetical protein